jgi:RecB family exonuclease
LVDYWLAPLADQTSLERRIDLSEHLVVVPTASSMREFLALFARRAKADRFLLFPPRIITIGQIDSYLLSPEPRLASPLERELAWFQAIQSADSLTQTTLLGQGLVAESLTNRRTYARLFVDLHDQLAAENHWLENLHESLSQEEPISRQRWAALSDLFRRYLEILDQANRVDPAWHRRQSLAQKVSPIPGPVWLVNTVDLRPASVEVLTASARAGTHICSLLFAPEDRQADFDPFGRLVIDRWIKQPIPIDDTQIVVTAHPSDQSRAVLQILDEWKDHPPQEIVVGLLDPDIIPRLAADAQRLGRELDSFQPRPPLRSAPLSLLYHVIQYTLHQQAADLARLVRHPHFAAVLAKRAAVSPTSILNDLDNLRATRLPSHLRMDDLHDLSWGSHLAQLLQSWPKESSPSRPLQDWLVHFSELLIAIYDTPPDDATAQDLIHVGQALQQASELPASLTGAVSSQQAWEWLSALYAPPPSRKPISEATIRGQGWLDLPLDPARHVIIAGMNQERLGGSVHSPFLTESVCEQLHFSIDAERIARDRYALSMILASRANVRLLLARASADKDPLTPSSLLLADSAQTRAKRLLMFFSQSIPERSIHSPAQPQIKVSPPNPNTVPSIDSLRVTAFRDFLLCPYRFYLKHVRNLVSITDDPQELDPLAFGNIFHDIFEAFGRSQLARSPDPEPIADFLIAHWQETRRTEFEGSLPTVLIQGEQIERRLLAFAHWQAQRTREGWEILDVELQAQGKSVPFVVDRRPFYLRGRIDRVDIHRQTGQIAIIDYKTGDESSEPDDKHRSGDQWIDLQLPLYRHLIKGTAIDPSLLHSHPNMVLGYVCVPKATDKTDFYPADWSNDDLEDADQVAADIIRSLRAGQFLPRSMSSKAITQFPQFSRICQDGLLGHE